MPIRTIRLFGTYRRFGDAVDVDVADGATAADIKAGLAATLQGRNPDEALGRLVRASALATDAVVMLDDMVPAPDARLAVLPPVSGG